MPKDMQSQVQKNIASYEAAIAAQDTPPPESLQHACAVGHMSAADASCVCAGRQTPTKAGQAGVTLDLGPHMSHSTASVSRGNTLPATLPLKRKDHPSDSSSPSTMSPVSSPEMSPKGDESFYSDKLTEEERGKIPPILPLVKLYDQLGSKSESRKGADMGYRL